MFLKSENRIFAKGLTHAFGQKMKIFHYLFSLKITLEIGFNNVLKRKEPFLGLKKNFV